jgi:HK97 family phage major capsid protein
MTMPTNATLPDVYWDTQLSTLELAAPSAESLVPVDQQTMVAHKLTAIDTLSIELTQDAVVNVANFVSDMFGIATAQAEDIQAFTSTGTNAGPFVGLLKNGSIASVTAASTATSFEKALLTVDSGYDLLVKLLDSVDESVMDSPNSAILLSNSILNVLRRVKNSQNDPLFGTMASDVPQRIFGVPYVRTRVFPKNSDGTQNNIAFMLYGDFNYYLMGDRMQMAIDVSEHAAFSKGGIMLRLMERVSFKLLFNTIMGRLKTANS